MKYFSQYLKESETTKQESILDQPQPTLAPEVWSNDGDEYHLTPEAEDKIQAVVDWVSGKFNFASFNVNLTGSITSNLYSDSSDVDVHFNSLDVTDPDELNKQLRDSFSTEYPTEEKLIGKFPIEVYFQGNPNQDLMSVGCFDFLNKRWLVGPELVDPTVDSFAKYYQLDKKHISELVDEIRNIVFETYETSFSIVNAKSKDFIAEQIEHLMELLNDAKTVLDKIRQTRKSYSNPSSPEQAAEFRQKDEWKIADSSFKLMNKLGYLPLLAKFAEYSKALAESNGNAVEIAHAIVDNISFNAKSDTKLESKISAMDENVHEGVKEVLSTTMIASILAIPGILPAKTLQANLDNVIKPTSTLNSPEIKAAMDASINDDTKFGPMTYKNVLNAIARTLWDEARGEGTDGIDAVASVLLNRTGNDPDKYISVISKPLQFSGWNDYKGGWTDSTYKYFLPYRLIGDPKHATVSNKKIWHYCNEVANKLLHREFTSTVGNRNLYMNRKKAGKKAISDWGHLLDKKIGNHEFGYDKYQDGARKKKAANKMAASSKKSLSKRA